MQRPFSGERPSNQVYMHRASYVVMVAELLNFVVISSEILAGVLLFVL